MKIIVQKFGGSSLGTPEIRESVVYHVEGAIEEGFTPVVVVSAMGRAGDPYATDTLIHLTTDIRASTDARNLDLLTSCGETISAVVVAETLIAKGYKARAITGWQAGIVTDDAHSNARVLRIRPEKIRRMLEAGEIPVVTGFQGITEEGEITTLGRGGSDTTAVALGVVLGAEMVEIFTDVDGVKSADPRLVPEAPTLSSLTYREVSELAHLGAKVIHPRAVEIAMEQGLPLRVRSTKDTGKGTLICLKCKEFTDGGERIGDRVVTGIAHLSNRAHVRVSGVSDFNKSKMALKLFEALAAKGVSVDLIYVSPDLVAFIVDETKADQARSVLSELELAVKVETGFAKVSVIGAGMHGVPGVMARVVRALDAQGIPLYQTTDSHANISCLVKERDLTLAVRALYEEFRIEREVL